MLLQRFHMYIKDFQKHCIWINVIHTLICNYSEVECELYFESCFQKKNMVVDVFAYEILLSEVIAWVKIMSLLKSNIQR